IACWVAQQVAPRGSVMAIDISPDQIDQARQQAQRRSVRNIEFHVADAYSPRLPEGTFDLVYGRLVLSPLTRPAAALAAMRALVRPGGLVVCEEIDIGCWLCDPPATAITRFFALNGALGERLGEDFYLGASLHRLFREVGFARPEVGTNFALALRGERKRLLGVAFAGFAPGLVREGLASRGEGEWAAAGVVSGAGA